MGTRRVERGTVAKTVASTVHDRRKRLRLSQADLAVRMREAGRPMQVTGVSKIETGDRRVDVDDLVALAVALETTPQALLTGGAEPMTMWEGVDATPRLLPVWEAAQVSGLPMETVVAYLLLREGLVAVEPGTTRESTVRVTRQPQKAED